MKKIFIPSLLLSIFFIAGCGTSATPMPTTAPFETAAVQLMAATEAPIIVIPAETVIVRPALDVFYENALSSRLLLGLGTLKLAETSTPVTSEQAPQLLMLWYAFDTLTRSGTSAQVEVDSLLAQIEAAYTPEQIMAINAMHLTQTELQTWAQLNGITASGSGGQGQGQGSGLSPEARATKQAAQGTSGAANGGENGLAAAVTGALLVYLQSIQS